MNGDHLYDRPVRPALDAVASRVAQRRAERVPSLGPVRDEDWRTWWEAAGRAPELQALLQARAEAGFEHVSDPSVSVDTHVQLLVQACFAEAGTVWQHGDDRVLVPVR